jgi:acyl-CoA reductase-like NAD-dependent aldehyde dehydrogenase
LSRPVHIPVLRWGEAYSSLERSPLADVRTGAVVAEVSQANAGLVARDLGRAAAAQASLARFSTAELLAITRRAAELFAHGELPVGDEPQTPAGYLEQLAATTGMPHALGRRNVEKVRFVLDGMETVLAGLTRGLDLSTLDAGFGRLASGAVAFRRECDALGLVLPSNSPGVHALWLPAVALRVALAIKPGRQDPWTPYRIVQAFLAAGAPSAAFGFYPGDHAAASEILLRCGRSVLFGDAGTVAPWRGDPRIEVHGPGWSKVVFGADGAADWRRHLDVLVASIADNGGRSCVNASGIRTPAHGREMAAALAERLAAIEPRALDDPAAALVAFPSRAAAERLSAAIDRQLASGGAEDFTARYRRDGHNGRVAELDGCAFLLPTLVWCDDAAHPLAQAEYPFPFATVVELPESELVERLGPSLAVTAITEDPQLRRQLLQAPHVDRLSFAVVPTSRVSWDQPHEGNLFEHLYRRRAFTAAESAA